MKNLKSIFLALIAVCASLFLATSCGEEEKFDAYEIEGTYIGKLSLNGTTIEDVYSVTVQAISKSAVTVYADFYSSGSERPIDVSDFLFITSTYRRRHRRRG